MAQTNTVIDLTGLGADKFLQSASVSGSDLILTMNDGASYTVDMSALPDMHATSTVLDSNNNLVITMSDGTTMSTDLSSLYGDKFLQSVSLNGSTVEMTMNDGSIHSVNLSSVSEDKHLISVAPSSNTLIFTMSDGTTYSADMTNVQARVVSGQYIHSTREVQLSRDDGTTFSIDMTGVRGNLTSLELVNDVLIYLDENGANTVIDLSGFNNVGEYISISEKGSNNGVATLDSNGFIPTSQLPSYVDEVVEVANFAALPGIGEPSKIYITIDDSNTYRWGGSSYVALSSGAGGLVLGETSSTAYQGDKGKIAYDHSNVVSGNPHNVSVSEIPSLQAILDSKVDDSDLLSPSTTTNKVTTESDVAGMITSAGANYVDISNATSVPSTTNNVITENDIQGYIDQDNTVVRSITTATETRISNIVSISQADYDLIDTPQADKMYIII